MKSSELISIREPGAGREKETNQEKKEKLSIPEKIARAFTRQRYPLTEQGLELQRQVQEAIDNNDIARIEELQDQLPTVENPHLELYEDFELDDEQLQLYLKEHLANIQITKGCTHKCEFCAAGASDKVEFMPFPAVLKIMEYRLNNPSEKEQVLNDLFNEIQEKTGIDYSQERVGYGAVTYDEANYEGIMEQVAEILFNHIAYEQIKNLQKETNQEKKNYWYYRKINDTLIRMFHRAQPSPLLYYDSDPFDYQDKNFLHEDGRPANLADVIRIFYRNNKLIGGITTAGWSETNKVSQKAAEEIRKMYEENEKIFSANVNNFRISVNNTERVARRNYQDYVEMIKNVLTSLRGIPKKILMYQEENNTEFLIQVIDPLKKFIEENDFGLVVVESPKISSYSPDGGEDQEDHDVMACMPGYHIHPDGTIALQDFACDIRTHKGARPEDTGVKLFDHT
ncbi:hypothetical protein KKG22_00015 [Patescibacteria group bacterium]|nr:hypothetical protein [Patescibacteria group bacterium]MBU1721375.1 hypothetical protein [Patescibacteria group bacterium]MBU1900916.1 hypothetical protein [Patescibacteria group bacterium]